MQAIHQPLFPGTAVRHSLFLDHFTPSTIYPYPQPAWIRQYGLSSSEGAEGIQIKTVGNLIVAGGSELRVFEVREEPILLGDLDEGDSSDLVDGNVKVENEPQMDAEMGDDDGFRNIGDTFMTQKETKDQTRLKLHIVYQTTLHGTITGLAGIRTMSSLEDGLDRMLISFKDAKLALMEWSRGEVSTISMHTYERCKQVMFGDTESHRALLRTDPNNKLAALSLPSNALAMLPIVQDLMETEAAEAAYGKEVPYMPSFVLPLEEMSTTLCNVKDFHFLPGFNNPTIALLYEPVPTWTGRLGVRKDTFHLEVRTLDVLSKTYASLTAVEGLPMDAQYLLPCVSSIGGLIVITSTAIIHVDQNGRKVASSVNGWYSTITDLSANTEFESRKLELDGSGAVWVDDRNMLLTLKEGRSVQVRIELEGRAVDRLALQEHEAGQIVSATALTKIGSRGVFAGSAVGDSALYKFETEHYKLKFEDAIVDEKTDEVQEIDMDEDLYGDSTILPELNGSKQEETASRVFLHESDILPGLGYVEDMCLGASSNNSGSERVPQLTALHGSDRPSKVEVMTPGLDTKRRRQVSELKGSQNLWCLRPASRRSHAKAEAAFQTSGVLLSSNDDSSELFSWASEEADMQIIKSYDDRTVTAGPMFGGSAFVRITPSGIVLCDIDGESRQEMLDLGETDPIVAASISEPYVAMQHQSGRITCLQGNALTTNLRELHRPPDGEPLDLVLAVCIIDDDSGVFRTFDPSTGKQSEQPSGTKARAGTSSTANRMKLTDEQLLRLQNETPSISVSVEHDLEAAVGINRGSHWLCSVLKSGRMEIRTLPELDLVFASDGLPDGSLALIDDASGDTDDSRMVDPDEDEDDLIQGMIFAPLASRGSKPHLIVMHNNDQLVMYEATPRFTLENLGTDMARRSLAVRFKRTCTKMISRGRLSRQMIPWSNSTAAGLFVTGSSPFWITAHESTSVKFLPSPGPVHAFSPISESKNCLYLTADAQSATMHSMSSKTEVRLPLAGSGTVLPRSYTHLLFEPKSAQYVGAGALSVAYQLYSDECEIIPDPDFPNTTAPTIERSTLELFEPESWRVVDGYDFEENEVVLCIQTMLLESTSDPSGLKRFIVVGTGINRGEDMSGRGKSYVFEVVQTVADQEVDGESWRLRKLCEEDSKEPVSAIANLGKYVIMAEGQKIYVKAFDNEERLVPVAFLDANVYTTSIKTFKNLVLIGDLVKSVWFCVFQEDPFRLELIARDFQDAAIASIDFLSAEGKVGFIASDQAGNLRVLEWDSEQAGGIEGGDQLARRTEYNAGGVFTKTLTIARRRPNEEKNAMQSQITLINEFGALSTLIPSKAARFKRLQLLQGQLTRSVQHVAGLNPKAFRNVYNPLIPRAPTKTILDGQLLSTYLNLPISRQKELVEPIGTTRETVLNDLVDLSGFAGFF